MGAGELTINGRRVEVEADQLDWNLLEFLREHCRLTSVKNGCSGQGQCGACTVVVNGKARPSCAIRMRKAIGAQVWTLEGLDPVVRQLLSHSFAASGAVQCGFCTPGLLMRTKVLLDENPRARREEIARAIETHVCRCTGYMKILDAIEMARDHWPDRRVPPLRGESVLGGSLPKVDAVQLALGERPFVSDMTFPDMLQGALVFSPAPRARIVKIDTLAAANQPGVHRILTARDVPGQRFVGLLYDDWPLFVAEGETTFYTGSILALVLAETARQARAAARLVQVEYEELEGVFDCCRALEPDAPKVHPKGNLLAHQVFRWGDLEEGKQHAVHIESGEFQTQLIEHAFMEVEAALARPVGGEHGVLEVFSQSQGVFEDRRQIALLLGEPLDRVRVILVSAGGAFGGKEDLSVQGHAALAARLCHRPVRIVLERKESIRLHPKRHPIHIQISAGCDATGMLTFVQAKITGDTGAHASVGTKVLERALGHLTSAYRVEAVDVEARTVYTNNIPCGAMRGFGVNQANFAMEAILDRLAEQVGLDGWDIRWLNALQDGERMTTGQKVHSCGLKETLLAVREDYKNARFAGIACGIKNVGGGNGMPDIGRVQIRIEPEGELLVFVGYSEMGQGLFTVARQIVSQELSIPPERVTVRTSTEREVDCGMTTSSRGTVLMGNALFSACAAIKRRLAEGASLADLAGEEFFGEYVCDFTTAIGGPEREPITHMSYGFATQVAILDEQGRLERFIAAQDVGRIMNRTLCEGQIQGGVHMGLGSALTEELVLERGVPVNDTFRGLGLIRAPNLPPIEVRLVESAEKNSAYGSKGIGELPLVPVASAVAGALVRYDGIRRNRLPMRDSAAARALAGRRTG
ncbi:MAG: selenium-dependent xanthine dehydrogenase [Bradymonadales bacterium]|nr:selenium-dependent xanthine dehydrogenase [Bradymonadales bacterium]